MNPFKRTVAVTKDLTEQGSSKYILIVGGVTPRYYAVDGYTLSTTGSVVTFWRHDLPTSEQAVALPAAGDWLLIHRDKMARITTTGEILKETLGKDADESRKELGLDDIAVASPQSDRGYGIYL